MDLVCIFYRGTMNSMWSEIKGWAGSKTHMDTENWEQWALGRSVEGKLFFERQICKPLEQLVSSFHSEKKKHNNKQRTSACSETCAFYKWLCFTTDVFVLYWIFAWSNPAGQSHLMYSMCPLLLAAAYSVSQSSVDISIESLEGGRGAAQGYNDDLHREW